MDDANPTAQSPRSDPSGAAGATAPLLDKLLASLRPINAGLHQALAHRTLALLRQVRWLGEEIRARQADPDFESALSRMATGYQQQRQSAGDGVDRWRSGTVLAFDTDSGVTGLPPLFAFFLLHLLDAELRPPQPDRYRTLEHVGDFLRGMARRRDEHPLIGAVWQLESADSSSAVSRQFAVALRELDLDTDDAEKARLLAELISALDVQSHRPPKKADADQANRPASGREKQKKQKPKVTSRPRDRTATGTPVDDVRRHTFTFKEPPEPSQPEPKEDSGPSASFLSKTKPSRSNRADRKAERERCLQAIRGANWDLRPDHIDVLAHQEIAPLLRFISRRFKAALAANDMKFAAACAIYALILATGRDQHQVATIRISRRWTTARQSHQGLDLSLDEGLIRVPVLRPSSSVKRAEEWSGLVEPTDIALELPLPPTVIVRLQRLGRRYNGPSENWCLADLLPKGSVGGWIRQLASEATELPALTKHPVRSRRLLSSLLHEAGGDLAAAMLICGDTFGRSTAPLYYYSPRKSPLASLYRAAVWPMFLAKVPTDDGEGTHRIGSELLVRDDIVKDGLAAIQRALHGLSMRHSSRPLELRSQFHNALVNYTLTCLAMTSTHRPDAALFDLRLDQLDLEGRLVVLQDKRTDPEHFTRIATLSRKTAGQIRSYVSHLASLAGSESSSGLLKTYASQAIRSQDPLFFYIDDQDAVIPASLNLWYGSWPPMWQHLPGNWYRTFFATRMRELGAEPYLVMAQCGHLEASAHPFRDDGTLSAVRLSARLDNALAKFDELVGMRVWGKPSDVIDCLDIREPIRDWNPELARHLEAIRAASRQNLKLIATELRRVAEDARNAALEIVDDISPKLGKLLRQAKKRPEELSDNLRKAVTREFGLEQAQTLIDLLNAMHPDRPVMAISARMQMGREIRAISLLHHLDLPGIGQPFLSPPSPPSPFLPNGLVALRQVRCLRSEFLSRAEELREHRPMLFLVLALCLFGRIDRLSEIKRLALSAQSEGVIATGGAPSILFRSADTDGEEIIGISRIAALVMVVMQGETRSPEQFDRLGPDLREAFQAWFTSTPEGSELAHLLATVAMASHFELSGFSRLAASVEGCTSAAPDLQLCLLRDLPTYGIPMPAASSNDIQIINTPERADAAEAVALPQSYKGTALSFYNQVLIPLFNDVDESHRRLTLTKLRDRLKVVVTRFSNSRGIEHQLLRYALHLASYGSAKKQTLAPSTVFTYVTAIGRALVTRLGGVELTELCGDEFLERYLEIVEGKPTPDTARRAARQLLELHQFMVRNLDVEPIDSSALRPYLAGEVSGPSTAVVTTADCSRAAAVRIESGTPEQIRQDRLIRIFAALLQASGGRFREILFLRHSDFLTFGDIVLVSIRSHSRRGLKTRAARRLLNLGRYLTLEDRLLLALWLRGEEIRKAATNSSSAIMLSRDTDERFAIKDVNEHVIRIGVQEKFHFATGRPFWPHQLRHHFADRELRALAAELSSPLDPSTSQSLGEFQRGRAVRRVAVFMGHTTIATTLKSYFHHPWMFRNSEVTSLDDQVSIKQLAAITGKGEAAIYKQAVRPVSGFLPDGVDVNLDVVSKMVWSSAKDGAISEKASLHIQWVRFQPPDFLKFMPTRQAIPGFHAIDHLLRLASVQADLRPLSWVLGLTSEVVDALEDAARIAVQDHLLHRLDLERVSIKTNRRPRRIDREGLDRLPERLSQLDQADAEHLIDVFKQVNRGRFAERGSRFAGSHDQILAFAKQLSALGVKGPFEIEQVQDLHRVKDRWTLRYVHSLEKTPFNRLRWLLGITVVRLLACRSIINLPVSIES